MKQLQKSKLVALEWDENEARMVVASLRGRQLRIRAIERVELDADGEEVSSGELQAKIAGVLERHRVGKADCLLAVGRSAVELKQLTLPPAPDDELAEMVRFQSLREFTSIGEDWPIDFLPLDDDPQQARHVLAAALNPQSIASLRKTCEGLGLNVVSIAVRPCGMASLVARQFSLADDEAYLLIDPLEKQVDLAVLHGHSTVILRCARADCGAEGAGMNEAVLEVRRTIAAAANRLGTRRLTRIYLCGKGDSQRRFADRLQREFNLPVEQFDPFDGLTIDPGAGGPEDERARYAPLVGMLRDVVEQQRPAIDFLNPRRKPAPANNRRLTGIVAAAVVLFLLLGAFFLWRQLGDLDAEIERLTAKSASLNPLVERGGKIEKQAGELRAWSASDIDWLSEFHRLSLQLPPAKEVMVTQLRAGGLTEGGEMQLEGLVQNAGVIEQLTVGLRDEQHTVEHKVGQQSDKHPRYRWFFKSAVQIEGGEPSPSPAKTPAAAQTPAKNSAASSEQDSPRRAKGDA